MSKILLIVTTVLVLIAAALGFLTQTKVKGLKQEIASLSGQVTQKDTEIARLTGELKTATEEIATAKAKIEQIESDLATTQKALDDSKTQLADATRQIEERNTEIQNLNARIASGMSTDTVGTGEAPPEISEIRSKLKDTETQLAEARALNDSLTGKISEQESQVATLREKAERIERQEMARGLTGQVLAVNRAWNFAVLSIGSQHGVVANAEMIIVRDGQAIGKVKVTSVEPSTSIADVVPGSLARGAQIRPGDSVIYPGA